MDIVPKTLVMVGRGKSSIKITRLDSQTARQSWSRCRQLQPEDRHIIDSAALPIQLTFAKIRNRTGKAVILHDVILAATASGEIAICHNDTGANCCKRMSPTAQAVGKACQWTWLKDTLISADVAQEKEEVPVSTISDADHKRLKSDGGFPLYLRDVAVHIGLDDRVIDYGVLDKSSDGRLFIAHDITRASGTVCPELRKKHDTRYTWVWTPSGGAKIVGAATVISKAVYDRGKGKVESQARNPNVLAALGMVSNSDYHNLQQSGLLPIYLKDVFIDRIGVKIAVGYAVLDKAKAGALYLMHNNANVRGIPNGALKRKHDVTHSWKWDPTQSDLAGKLYSPATIVTKEEYIKARGYDKPVEEEKLAEMEEPKEETRMATTATYDKKMLIEKITVALGKQEAAIKAAVDISSDRAHKTLDEVLVTGKAVTIEDVVIAESITTVTAYKELLEELSLIAGDSVKASDLSKDPISLIRAAGDITPVKRSLYIGQ